MLLYWAVWWWKTFRRDSPQSAKHLEPLGPRALTLLGSYLLRHGSDAPVLGLGTGGVRGGRHPHLAAFPAEALGATVEAAQQVLGRNTAVHCGHLGSWLQAWAQTWPCLCDKSTDLAMSSSPSARFQVSLPAGRRKAESRGQKGALPKTGSCSGLPQRAPYLHWLQGGGERVLQRAAGQPPHFFSEHRARSHEDIPAKKARKEILNPYIFTVTKFRPLQTDVFSPPVSLQVLLPYHSCLQAIWYSMVILLLLKPF